MRYWRKPGRADLIRWAKATWPEGRFSGIRLNQLRAIWHNYNRGRYA